MYKLYENKFIIGKSSINQDNYNNLIFCVRNIETVIIPIFIEHICAFAFNNCEKLSIAEIPIDSKFYLFPDYLSIFFRKIENKSIAREIFKHAFCEQMIKNPSIFFATDYWRICFPTKSEEISDFLRKIINDQMIDDMLKIIEEKDNCYKWFLSKEIPSVYHQFILSNTFFDNFDLISLEFF